MENNFLVYNMSFDHLVLILPQVIMRTIFIFDVIVNKKVDSAL